MTVVAILPQNHGGGSSFGMGGSNSENDIRSSEVQLRQSPDTGRPMRYIQNGSSVPGKLSDVGCTELLRTGTVDMAVHAD